MSTASVSHATAALWPAQIRQNVVWMGMALIAILSAPGKHGGWPIFWLIVAAMFAAACLTEIHIARANEEPRSALNTLGIAIGSGLVAVVISMFLRPFSGLFLIIALALLAYTGKKRPFATAALTVVLVPWWVWMALGEWHWQLLLLVPLVGLGLIAVSHLLDTHAWPEDEERILPARAHRWAAWLLIALSGILLMTVGLLTDASRPFLALAGIVLALAIPLEAGFGTNTNHSARQSVRIVVGAYVIAVSCWLIGIA